MGTRALVFLLLAACSNDEFSNADTGVDAVADITVEKEAAVEDVAVESATADADAALGFCALQANGSFFFCDDFDVLAGVTDSFSVWTAGTIAFGAGKTGQGLAITAAAVNTVYVTKQVQANALHELDFAVRLGSVTLATYVTLTAGSSSFGLGVDLSSNFTIQGDASSNSTLAKADTNWHSIVVKFANGKATVSLDSNTPVAVTFTAAAPTASSLNLGVVVGSLGGKVTFDDVVLR